MKKSVIIAALAGIVLAGCAKNEFVGTSFKGGDEISFSNLKGNMTKAGLEDAGELGAGASFRVFGTKAGESSTTVFPSYSVVFSEDSWNYVGTFDEQQQTIKFWDYSASEYEFIAGAPASAVSGMSAGGFTLTMPENSGKAYVADRATVLPTAYGQTVTMRFRQIGATIRLGFYEAIDGYSVKDLKFSYGTTNVSETVGLAGLFPASSKYNVTYNGEGKAVVTPADTDANPETTKTFTWADGYVSSTTAIATSSASATKTNTVGVTPTTVGAAMTLKVDFTLKADDTQEEIQVHGATVTVPESYTQWQTNYAYTYIFKFTNDCNGYTGDDPADSGLKPIVFDAEASARTEYVFPEININD